MLIRREIPFHENIFRLQIHMNNVLTVETLQRSQNLLCYSLELRLVKMLFVMGKSPSLHHLLDNVIGVGVLIDLENSDDIWVCHTHQDVNFILLSLSLML